MGNWRRRTVAFLVALVATFSLTTAPPAHAWPGMLEDSFGDGGSVVLVPSTNQGDAGLTVLADDRIVVAWQDRVMLFTADGEPDLSFGASGVAYLGQFVVAASVVAQPDGKLVVVGNRRDPGGSRRGVIFRLLSTGVRDETFGTSGVVATDLVEGWRGVLVGSGGAIITAGGPEDLPTGDLVVARFGPTGAADSSFAGTGYRPFSRSEHEHFFGAMALQSDGALVIGGNFGSGWVERIEADGTDDESFGTDGRTYLSSWLYKLIVEPDGRILAATETLVRLSRGGGIVQVLPVPGTLGKVVRQPDGRIVTAFAPPSPTRWDIHLNRFEQDLSADVGFGHKGGAVPVLGGVPTGLALQARGTIVVLGLHQPGALALTVVRGGRPAGLVLDGWGGLHPFGPGTTKPALTIQGAPYWSGWDIARGLATLAGPSGIKGGYVLDGWGGIHRFGVNGQTKPPAVNHGSPYWKGWDIARDIAVLPDGSGGYVLDGWGGLHPVGFGNKPAPPAAKFGPYWPGWDIARGVALLPDGTGGYVLDGWGGVHPFAIGTNPKPPALTGGPYWPGWDIARGLSIVPEGNGAYVLDGWGGTHRLGGAPVPTGTPYWPGWDIARSISVP